MSGRTKFRKEKTLKPKTYTLHFSEIDGSHEFNIGYTVVKIWVTEKELNRQIEAGLISRCKRVYFNKRVIKPVNKRLIQPPVSKKKIVAKKKPQEKFPLTPSPPVPCTPINCEKG